MRIEDPQSGSTFHAMAGEPIELVVIENGATGFRWNLEGLPTSVESSFAAPGATPGAAGRRTFRFESPEPGEYPLKLQLKAIWEKDPEAITEFSLIVA